MDMEMIDGGGLMAERRKRGRVMVLMCPRSTPRKGHKMLSQPYSLSYRRSEVSSLTSPAVHKTMTPCE
jgi:hypothetical protein